MTARKSLSVFRLARLAAAIVAVNSITAVAQDDQELPRNSQEPPGPQAYHAPGAGIPGADPFHLLTNSSEVQQDLHLTQAQIRQLSRIGGSFRMTMAESSYRSESEVRQRVESGKEMLARVLTPGQVTRLRQIMLQIEGPCGLLSDPQALERLGIPVSSTQLNRMENVCREAGNRIRSLAEITQRRQDNPCLAMADMAKQTHGITAHTEEQIAGILSSLQRATLQDMKGPILKLTPMTPPGCPGAS